MCIICTGDYDEKMEVLYCNGCTALTEIPILPNLTKLFCSGCTALTEIPILPNLTKLFCIGCTSLTKIPNLPKLTRLYCSGCTALTEIPSLPKLTLLYCYGCTILTKIPSNLNLDELECDECKWIPYNDEYNENLSLLVKAQKIVKRKLGTRKLIGIMPQILEIYYSPGFKGALLAEKSFSKLN
jgi:hypothetical protein